MENASREESALHAQDIARLAQVFWLKKISQKYPDWKTEWIQVATDIAGVTKLLLSQKWLDENNMPEYKHTKGGQDLGYVPDEKGGTNVDDVKKLLESGRKFNDKNIRAEPHRFKKYLL